MSRPKRLREMWEIYRLIIPRDASQTQLIETKRAFYVGAGSMFDLVMEVSRSPEVEEGDLRLMDDIHKELRDWLDEQKREHGVDFKIGSA